MATRKKAVRTKSNSTKKSESAGGGIRQDVTLWPEAMLKSLKDVFSSYEDYRYFKLMALADFQKMTTGPQHTSLKKVIPERIRIIFTRKTKAVQIYFPRYTGVIIVEHPAEKLTNKQKILIRHKCNILYGPLVKINEDIMADAWAIKMKILKRRKRK